MPKTRTTLAAPLDSPDSQMRDPGLPAIAILPWPPPGELVSFQMLQHWRSQHLRAEHCGEVGNLKTPF